MTNVTDEPKENREGEGLDLTNFFEIQTDIGIINMPAENEQEAGAKAKIAMPQIKEIKGIRRMAELEAAESEIINAKNMIMGSGATDREPSVIENIITRLRGGEITPVNAVKEVRKIASQRQEYH